MGGSIAFALGMKYACLRPIDVYFWAEGADAANTHAWGSSDVIFHRICGPTSGTMQGLPSQMLHVRPRARAQIAQSSSCTQTNAHCSLCDCTLLFVQSHMLHLYAFSCGFVKSHKLHFFKKMHIVVCAIALCCLCDCTLLFVRLCTGWFWISGFPRLQAPFWSHLVVGGVYPSC